MEFQMEYKLVIAVRDDLKLSPGKLAAQVGHATVDCVLATRNNNMKWFRKWHSEGQKKVVVKVGELDELYELKNVARRNKLSTSMIADAGLTELPPGTITCLGVGPGPSTLVDKVTGDLPLL
jgi:PTH2 family peptidyl-tRNA hydrolase